MMEWVSQVSSHSIKRANSSTIGRLCRASKTSSGRETGPTPSMSCAICHSAAPSGVARRSLVRSACPSHPPPSCVMSASLPHPNPFHSALQRYQIVGEAVEVALREAMESLQEVTILEEGDRSETRRHSLPHNPSLKTACKASSLIPTTSNNALRYSAGTTRQPPSPSRGTPRTPSCRSSGIKMSRAGKPFLRLSSRPSLRT